MALIRLDLYDKNRVWQAPVGAFVSCEGTQRFDNISDLSFTVKATHKRLPLMLTPGTRVRCQLRGQTIIEGPIRGQSGYGPGVSGQFTFDVEDNFRILRNYLIYQKPGESMANQSLAYNYTATGDAETVFKDIVNLNIGSRGIEPIIIASNLHRGGTITASARMATIYNEMFPLLESVGLGARVTATPAGLVVDVYEPGTYANPLTEQSRVIRKWKYKATPPEVTHVVVAGQGEGTARTFIDSYVAETESIWGDRIEVLRDARDASDLSTYYDRATETLFEGRPQGSLELTLAETGNFKIGGPNGLKVGQKVTAKVANGLIEVTDILREIEFSYDEDGLKTTGTIGQSLSSPYQMAQAISKMSGAFNKLKGSQ